MVETLRADRDPECVIPLPWWPACSNSWLGIIMNLNLGHGARAEDKRFINAGTGRVSMSTTQELLSIADGTGHTGYRPARMVLERAEGLYVYDKEGKRYLDFLAGIAVNCLGHCHPKIVAALCNQAGTLLQVSNASTATSRSGRRSC